MIARWPGRIPAGRVSPALTGVIDWFPTCSALAGVPLPHGRVIDGKDLTPVLTGEASDSPHQAIFAMAGAELRAMRSGKWKLIVGSPGPADLVTAEPGKPWVDPRGPDGVTILAPFEQAQPSAHPGVTTGDPPAEVMLFDLEADPAEQRNLAARHPEMVTRLRRQFDEVARQVPAFPPPKRIPNLLRLKGGSFDYHQLPAAR
jgi:arylsulfatase A-like enzyme